MDLKSLTSAAPKPGFALPRGRDQSVFSAEKQRFWAISQIIVSLY